MNTCFSSEVLRACLVRRGAWLVNVDGNPTIFVCGQHVGLYLKSRFEKHKLDLSVFDLDLSVRTSNILLQNSLSTVQDILNAGKETIMSFSHFGQRQLTELEEVLSAYNCTLK